MVYFNIFINSITLDRTIKGRPDEHVFTLTSLFARVDGDANLNMLKM